MDSKAPSRRKMPAIGGALKAELQKRVSLTKARVQKKYAKENVEWDVNNTDRSNRGKPFHYKTNGGVELKFEQKTDDVGGVVWTATIQFSKYLEKRHENKSPSLEGLRVLELGCGTGMVGIISAALGAKVTCTDLPNIFPRATKNIEVNADAIKKGGGTARACAFTWGDRDAKVVEKGTSPYDLILASEVIYTKESARLFLDALEHVFGDNSISHSKTELLLAGDLRGRVGRIALLEAAQKKFQIREIKESEMDPNWISDKVALHSIRPKA
ncbi:hypothetical protein AAMO2058_000101600 [Amorphochlora amoebiformis]